MKYSLYFLWLCAAHDTTTTICRANDIHSLALRALPKDRLGPKRAFNVCLRILVYWSPVSGASFSNSKAAHTGRPGSGVEVADCLII